MALVGVSNEIGEDQLLKGRGIMLVWAVVIPMEKERFP